MTEAWPLFWNWSLCLYEILRAGKTFLLLHSNILLAWVRKLPLSAWTSDVHALAAQWPVTKNKLRLWTWWILYNFEEVSLCVNCIWIRQVEAGNLMEISMSHQSCFFSTQVFQSQKRWFDVGNVVQKTQAKKPHLGLISEFIFIFVPQQTPDFFSQWKTSWKNSAPLKLSTFRILF